MRNRLLLVVAVAMFFVLPAASANAYPNEESITFEGAGWGHGVGMSQYGAYGRALDGQTYTEILTAADTGYYQGTTIGTLGNEVADPGALFTNVASDATSTTLTVYDGPAAPRNGMVITRRTGEAVEPTATLFSGDTAAIVDTTNQMGEPGG